MSADHGHDARRRKAADIWERLRDMCPEFDPTNDEICSASKALGYGDPSTATCDRVRAIAAHEQTLAGRTAADILTLPGDPT